MKIQRTARGARLLQGGAVLSEILDHPGPTHSLFDLLAAGIQALCPEGRIGLLGFAGGGLVAPLRAMGHRGPLEAVDLSREALPLFRELGKGWAGRVRVQERDAAVWLSEQEPFDLLLDDLSVEIDEEETKPELSYLGMPELARAKLRPSGLYLVNLLPVPGWSWKELQATVREPFAKARLICCEEYENRLLIAGQDVPTASVLRRRLGAALRSIGSEQARRFRVRNLRRG